MYQSYQKLFSKISQLEPPADLAEKILHYLGKERRSAVRRRLVLLTCLMLISAAALLPTGQMARTELSQSGFWQFLSLIFSDFKLIQNFWQSFLLSLLETLPALSLALFLAALLVFLESLKFFAHDLKFYFNLN